MANSTKQQSTSNQSLVKKLVLRLAHRFPLLPWDDVLREEYERILAALTTERGLSNVELGVTRLIDSEQFLDPAKLRALVPLRVQQNRCDNCRENEGWIFVLVDGETSHRLLRCKHQDGLVSIQVKIPDKFKPWEKQTVNATVLAAPIHPDPPVALPRMEYKGKAYIPTVTELARQTAALKDKFMRAKRMP